MQIRFLCLTLVVLMGLSACSGEVPVWLTPMEAAAEAPAATATPTPAPTPTPLAEPTPTPIAQPQPTATPEPTPTPTPAPTAEATPTPTPVPESGFSDLTAVCETSTSTLSWSDPAETQLVLVEARAFGDPVYIDQGLVPSGSGKFNDTQLTPLTIYEYRLTATTSGEDIVGFVACTTDDGRVPYPEPLPAIDIGYAVGGVEVTIPEWSSCDLLIWGDAVEPSPGTYLASAELLQAGPLTPCADVTRSTSSNFYEVPTSVTGTFTFQVSGTTVAEMALVPIDGDSIAPATIRGAVSGTTVELTWEHDRANVDHFELVRRIGASGANGVSLPDVPASSGGINELSLLPATTYCWTLRVVSPRGTKSEATETCARTQGLATVVFVSTRDGSPEIYTVAADGSQEERLTDDSIPESSPTWSPDKSQILFSARSGGVRQIWVMNANGTGKTQLTDDDADDWMPAWSPDGSRIAWASFRDGNSEIYVMNANGSGETRLTSAPGNDEAPVWSPDGSKIAFISHRDADKEIYVMDVDGANQTRLSDSQGEDLHPTWSPDSTKVAYESIRDIYIVNADGTNTVRLTTRSGREHEPEWSPDGGLIAFTRDGQIYTITESGDNETALTARAGENSAPTWSSDGAQIVFVSTRDGDTEIFVMDADGGDEVQTTSNSDGDDQPHW